MLSRRELFSTGVAGGLTAGAPSSSSTAASVEQESTREGQREIARAVDDVEEIIKQSLLPTLAYGNVGRIRGMMEQFVRSHAKFPDYFEVGAGVFIDLYDWHVKYQQPLNVTRQPDGRYLMQFMFSTLLLRPEQDSGYIGYPYDKA